MLKMIQIDKNKWSISDIFYRKDGNKVTIPLIIGFSKKTVKICLNALKEEIEDAQDSKKAKEVLNKLKSGKTKTVSWKK